MLSNIAPSETHDIVVNYLEGNVKLSLEQQLKYYPLIDALFCEVNPIPVKKAMNLMGFEVGGLRKPLTEMEPENTEKLIKAMKEAGLKLI